MKKAQKALVKLIINYIVNNFHANDKEMSKTVAIPVYVQQLFDNLIHDLHKQDDGYMCIIRSQYELLNESLQNESFQFNDGDNVDDIKDKSVNLSKFDQ